MSVIRSHHHLSLYVMIGPLIHLLTVPLTEVFVMRVYTLVEKLIRNPLIQHGRAIVLRGNLPGKSRFLKPPDYGNQAPLLHDS